MIAQPVQNPSTAEGSAPGTTSTLIRQAAVLGAGTMGSRIAAHLANTGVPVLLLDLARPEGPRSAIAAQALEALKVDHETSCPPFTGMASGGCRWSRTKHRIADLTPVLLVSVG